MNNINLLGTIFILATLSGFYLAYLYGRKTKIFRWSEYIAIIIWPLLAVVGFAIFVDVKMLSLFFVSCAVGFLFEYLVGLVYHRTLNKRLWTYNRLSVQGYTSLLSIPLWGVAGILFWLIGKMIGL